MKSLQVGTAHARRGERALGVIKASELNDGSPVEIPVAVLHGAEDGPVVWMQNGVHGGEYTGMGGIQRIIHEVDPKELKGSIVALPMVNILAYRAGVRSAPQDGLDMNRSYPGRPIERAMHVFSHTEIVVHTVFEEIKRVADYVLDCHAGGWYSTMSPYAQYFTGLGGSSEYEEACKGLAEASGLTIVWRTEAGFVAEKAPGSLKVWAAKVGIPSVTLEVGGQGRLEEAEVARFHLALENILKHLDVIPGDVVIPEPQLRVSKGNWLRPKTGGSLWTTVKPLDRVKKGQVIHIIKDLLGRERERLLAPADGVVVGIRTLGTVNSGEYCGNVGIVDND